jgi:ParB family transcriptional regulator, chromosome partitioning protein
LSYLGILQDVNISKISPCKNNLRENTSNIDELAESIKLYGLLQPIVIRPKNNRYEVVAGNRRLAAAKLLKLRKLSCHIIELSDKEAFEVGLIENVQHKTMNPVEESIAFKKYVQSYGWGGVSDLARQIGKSQEFVTKRIQLLLLPSEIQEEIIRQRITPSVALELVTLDENLVLKMSKYVIGNSLTKSEARKLVKKISKQDSMLDRDNNTEDKVEHDETNDLSNYDKELLLLDKALMKSITIMKSSLVSFDDVINSIDYNWILKELLMQYRLIIHGDIDTFLRLRKRLKSKMPYNYPGNNAIDKTIGWSINDRDDDVIRPIHLGTTFLS